MKWKWKQRKKKKKQLTKHREYGWLHHVIFFLKCDTLLSYSIYRLQNRNVVELWYLIVICMNCSTNQFQLAWRVPLVHWRRALFQSYPRDWLLQLLIQAKMTKLETNTKTEQADKTLTISIMFKLTNVVNLWEKETETKRETYPFLFGFKTIFAFHLRDFRHNNFHFDKLFINHGFIVEAKK